MKTTIRTRYTGPTDTRGARIVARAAGRQCSIPYPYHLNTADAHRAAAAALCQRNSLDPSALVEIDSTPGSKAPGYCFTIDGTPRAPYYVNREGGGYRETVDEFPTRKEALSMLREYRSSDHAGTYWLSSRPCAGYHAAPTA